MTYEMLVGRPPFSGMRIESNLNDLPGNYLSALLAPLSSAPSAWRTFLARALAYDPSSRPDSARTFCVELERALQGTS
jgi:serine/threonine protein kinase